MLNLLNNSSFEVWKKKWVMWSHTVCKSKARPVYISDNGSVARTFGSLSEKCLDFTGKQFTRKVLLRGFSDYVFHQATQMAQGTIWKLKEIAKYHTAVSSSLIFHVLLGFWPYFPLMGCAPPPIYGFVLVNHLIFVYNIMYEKFHTWFI